jgi:pimeloyl-ACP methyl ester carboxylesterase
MPHGSSVNVYIGSDGTPWNFDVAADDPTPRNPLTLRLMVQDPQPAILVGRPCYHGLSDSHECNQAIWTSARYSRTVVESMALAIQEYVARDSFNSITLIGYSGGGTLAALIAGELDQVNTLITVAANLDTDAWTRYHRYEPLFESLNPAEEPPLSESITQVHYFGALDKNVPMSTTDRFFLVNSSAERREIADFDHVCCWTEIWQTILPNAE